MSDQPKKSNFFEKLATFIVDKRNLIFFLYAIAIIASLITQSWVKVCDDLTQYLPETTETRRGLTLMEDEMKTYGTARIIVSHVTYEIARDLADQIEDLNNISSVDFWDADKSADDTTLPSAANKTYEDYMLSLIHILQSSTPASSALCRASSTAAGSISPPQMS